MPFVISRAMARVHEPILSFLPIVRAARTAAEYETSAQIPSNGCVAYKVIIIALETPTAA